MSVPSGSIIRVVLHHEQVNAGDMQNVFHFLYAGSAIDENDLYDDIDNWAENVWGAAWQDVAVSGCTMASWEADVVNKDGTVEKNLGGNILGLSGFVTGDMSAPGTAAYLLAYTAVPKARGSKYIPGMGENSWSSGEGNAQVLIDLLVLLAVYLVPIATTGGGALTPGVVSRVAELFIAFAGNGVIDNLLAYQRRRKVGVGI